MNNKELIAYSSSISSFMCLVKTPNHLLIANKGHSRVDAKMLKIVTFSKIAHIKILYFPFLSYKF